MTQSQFLQSAAIFEGVLLLVAFVSGWMTGVGPTDKLYWSWNDFLLGLLATVPMLLFLAICYLSPSAAMRQIRSFLREFIGPYLNRCRGIDLLLLALLAGVCEEVFFRGFLFLWLNTWNSVIAVMVSNLLFAAAHAVTPVYAMLAGFLGLYLTALLAADPTPNLLIPIIAHTLYDLVAFVVVLRDYRKHAAEG